MIAIEYKVADRLLFGSDFPGAHPRAGHRRVPRHQRLGRGRSPCRGIPEETIEAIMHERPLAMLGIEPAPAGCMTLGTAC